VVVQELEMTGGRTGRGLIEVDKVDKVDRVDKVDKVNQQKYAIHSLLFISRCILQRFFY
jgi:hypothetical protein